MLLFDGVFLSNSFLTDMLSSIYNALPQESTVYLKTNEHSSHLEPFVIWFARAPAPEPATQLVLRVHPSITLSLLHSGASLLHCGEQQ